MGGARRMSTWLNCSRVALGYVTSHSSLGAWAEETGKSTLMLHLCSHNRNRGIHGTSLVMRGLTSSVNVNDSQATQARVHDRAPLASSPGSRYRAWYTLYAHALIMPKYGMIN